MTNLEKFAAENCRSDNTVLSIQTARPCRPKASNVTCTEGWKSKNKCHQQLELTECEIYHSRAAINLQNI